MTNQPGSPMRLPSRRQQARMLRRREREQLGADSSWAQEQEEDLRTGRGYTARGNADDQYSGRDPEDY